MIINYNEAITEGVPFEVVGGRKFLESWKKMWNDMKDEHVRTLGITFEDHSDFPTPVKRNAQGYPLLEDGTIDWERTSEEKETMRLNWEVKEHAKHGKQRSQNTHLTPPKKKRKR